MGPRKRSGSLIHQFKLLAGKLEWPTEASDWRFLRGSQRFQPENLQALRANQKENPTPKTNTPKGPKKTQLTWEVAAGTAGLSPTEVSDRGVLHGGKTTRVKPIWVARLFLLEGSQKRTTVIVGGVYKKADP